MFMKVYMEDFKMFIWVEEFNWLGMDVIIVLEGEMGKYYWFSKYGFDELI